jgi:hypothetical protein
MIENRTVSFFIVKAWSGIMMLSILFSGCVGFSIKKPPPPEGVKENYLIENREVRFPRKSKVAFLVTSYDFIKQQNQPFFLADRDAPEYIYLDYHHGKEDVAFDEAFRERIQLFLKEECSINAFDLKRNDKFSSFAKSASLQLSDIIAWLGSNTNIDLLLVFHYSLGEKGEAHTTRRIRIFIDVDWTTKIEKFSAFTFQASAFDIQEKQRVMAYNFPAFVDPSAAVDVFITRAPEFTENTKTFYEVLSLLFGLNE